MGGSFCNSNISWFQELLSKLEQIKGNYKPICLESVDLTGNHLALMQNGLVILLIWLVITFICHALMQNHPALLVSCGHIELIGLDWMSWWWCYSAWATHFWSEQFSWVLLYQLGPPTFEVHIIVAWASSNWSAHYISLGYLVLKWTMLLAVHI